MELRDKESKIKLEEWNFKISLTLKGEPMTWPTTSTIAAKMRELLLGAGYSWHEGMGPFAEYIDNGYSED